jgi:hypothetical protein
MRIQGRQRWRGSGTPHRVLLFHGAPWKYWNWTRPKNWSRNTQALDSAKMASLQGDRFVPSLSYLSWGIDQIGWHFPKTPNWPYIIFFIPPQNPRLWLLIILGSRIGGNSYNMLTVEHYTPVSMLIDFPCKFHDQPQESLRFLAPRYDERWRSKSLLNPTFMAGQSPSSNGFAGGFSSHVWLASLFYQGLLFFQDFRMEWSKKPLLSRSS